MDRSKLETFDKSIVTSRLHRWGAWKMRSGVALGYQSMSSFMRLSGRSTTLENIVDEIDSECVQTDTAVNVLPYFHWVVIRAEYVLHAGKKGNEKAVICGVSKRAYYNYLDAAHSHVARNLNLLLISVHSSDINVLSVSKVRLA